MAKQAQHVVGSLRSEQGARVLKLPVLGVVALGGQVVLKNGAIKFYVGVVEPSPPIAMNLTASYMPKVLAQV